MRNLVLIIPFSLLLSACANSVSIIATPTVSRIGTQPSLNNTGIATRTITDSPVDQEIITPENIHMMSLKSTNMERSTADPFYSSDGNWLFASSSVGIFAFDMISYDSIRLISSVPYGRLSPNGKIIVSPDGGHLYSVEGNQKISDLEFPPGWSSLPKYGGMFFSSDNSIISQNYSTETGWTAAWRVIDGKFINHFEGGNARISADNRLIAVQQAEKNTAADGFIYSVILYDLQSAEPLREFPGTLNSFMSDNSLVIESGGYVRIYDSAAYKVKNYFKGDRAQLSPDESLLALYVGNGCVNVYRIKDHTRLRTLAVRLNGWFMDARFKFNPDGSILAIEMFTGVCCGGDFRELSLWNTENGRLIKDFHYSQPYMFSPDGQTITVGKLVLRAADGSILAKLPSFIQYISNMVFTPDGRQLLVDTRNYGVYMTLDPELLFSYEVGDAPIWYPRIADREKYLSLLTAASPRADKTGTVMESPNGKDFAGLFSDTVVFHFDGRTFSVYGPQPTRAVFSPGGRLAAVGYYSGDVTIWDFQARQEVFKIIPETRQRKESYGVYIGGLAFSPDGKLLAVGFYDGSVRVYGIPAN